MARLEVHLFLISLSIRSSNTQLGNSITMVASQPRPTLLFVHGAWHDPSCFDLLRSQLTQYSYPSTAVALPSTGASEPSKQTHLEDVAEIRKTLEQLIFREAKEVVLVAHSYGGVPGSESVEGFERAARESKGSQGGVIACVFIAAALPLKGNSLRDTTKDWSFPFRGVEVQLRVSFPHHF